MPFIFTKLEIPDLVLIKPRIFPDGRGMFAETYKESEFAANGISGCFVQDNQSTSAKGVLRGLHYQVEPCAQGKLIRVPVGRIWDVAVDIRRGSPTFGRWCGVEISDEDMAMLWIPPGFAHGFVSLTDSVTLAYKCTAEYHKAAERGIRWDDQDLAIAWPLQEVTVSPRDATLPRFHEAELFTHA